MSEKTGILLSPFTKSTFNKIEKPIIVFAQDNSSSILMNKDSVYYKTLYQEKIAELTQKLSGNFEVKSYTFGDELEETTLFEYNEKRGILLSIITKFC